MNPLERLVTLYSCGTSWVSIGVCPCRKAQGLVRECLKYKKTYFEWLSWVESGNLVRAGVFIKSVENSVNVAWVGSEGSVLFEGKEGLNLRTRDLP